MKQILIFLSVGFLFGCSLSQELPGSQEPQVKHDILKKSKRTPAETSGTREIHVHTDLGSSSNFKGYDVESFPTYGPSELPPPEIRYRIVQMAGLEKYVSNMDTLDLDLLYLKSLKYEKEILLQEYPHLPPDALKRFMKITRQYHRKQKD